MIHLMQSEQVGGRIRELRDRVGLQAKQLADEIELDSSAMSNIESGKRAVKTGELAKIASVLGVSPLYLLEPDSLLARLPVAARSTSDELDKELNLRLIALAELHSVLRHAGIESQRLTLTPPSLGEVEWLQGAKERAAWALTQLQFQQEGDRFSLLAAAIEDKLGINVLVEPHDPSALGAAITDPEFPFILVNSDQPCNRALFTLAHELGHVLAQDGEALVVHRNLSGTDTQERSANAFAAEFLMPEGEIEALFEEGGSSPETLANIMLHFSVSWESLVYRLHNLRKIDADGRDRLREVGYAGLIRAVSEGDLVKQLEEQRKPCGTRVPSLLVDRLKTGFEKGIVSIRPLAGLLRRDPEDLLAELEAVEIAAEDLIEPLSAVPASVESVEQLYCGEPV